MPMKRVMRVKRMTRVIGFLVLALVLVMPRVVEAQPQPPSGFVPAEEVPPGEQIPAINLVAAAYGFVWVALLGYVWSLARRLKTVEAELADLEAKKR